MHEKSQIQKTIKTMRLIRQDQVLQATLCLVQATLENLLYQERVEKFLHIKEKEYLNNLVYPQRKLSYLLGRYCAKQVLCQQFRGTAMSDILINPGVFGQPIVRSLHTPSAQVSIAHSKNLGVALAFEAIHPMGIDIEIVSPETVSTVLPELTQQEKALLQEKWQIASGCRYTWIWTVKEALGKILKTGLMTPLFIYEIDDIRYQNAYILAKYKNFPQYQALSFFYKDAIVSIALPQATHLSF